MSPRQHARRTFCAKRKNACAWRCMPPTRPGSTST
jgi:hypothetical protein